MKYFIIMIAAMYSDDTNPIKLHAQTDRHTIHIYYEDIQTSYN